MKRGFKIIILLLACVSLHAQTFRVLSWCSDAVVITTTVGAAKVMLKTPHTSSVTIDLPVSKVEHGVYYLPLPAQTLLFEEGQMLTFTFLSADNKTVMTKQLRVPVLIASNESLSEHDISLCTDNDLVILNGGVLNVDPDVETYSFRSVWVQGGGRLVIPANAVLQTDTVYLKAGMFTSSSYEYVYPQVVVRGSLLNTSGLIYYDYLISKEKYYSLALPQTVSVSDITDLDGKKLKLGQDFYLAHYDGATRAAGDYGWTTYSGTSLFKGAGYIVSVNPPYIRIGEAEHVQQNYAYIRIPMHMDFTNGDLLEDNVVPVNSYPSSTGFDNDAGWNLVGNPFWADYVGNIDGLDASNGIGLLEEYDSNYKWTGALRYVIIPDDSGESYFPMLASAATLPAFKNFFVQIGSGDALKFLVNNRRQNIVGLSHELPSSKNRLKEEDNVGEIMTGIRLYSKQNTKKDDKLGILISEDFTAEYEFNADLTKWMNSGLNLYAFQSGKELAFIAVNDTLSQHINIGYTAPQQGNYVFSLNNDYMNEDIQDIILYDLKENLSVSLMGSDYEFNTVSGTNNSRFVLSVLLKNAVSTNILETENESQAFTKKIFKGGDLYIVNDKHVYSVLGILIK